MLRAVPVNAVRLTAVRLLVAAALVLGVVAALPAAPARAATVPNLLSLNQASSEASIVGFARGTRRESLVRTCALAATGRCSLELISTTTSSMAARTLMQGQVVVPGGVYTASTLVRPISTTRVPAPARLVVVYTSATGRTLATAAGPWTTLRVGRWTRVSRVAAAAPAGTASVSVWLWIASTRVKDAYVSDAWGLWRTSTLPAWSLPVVSPDSIAPTAPSGVVLAPTGDPGTLTARWTASTDNVGVAGYRIWLAPAPGSGVTATPTGTTTATTWTSPLLATGSWTVQVVAVDRSGRTSAPSTAVTTALALRPTSENLLTANQADVETSTAGFDAASAATGTVALARTTTAALSGAGSLALTAVAGGSLNARTARSWTPAAPGAAYSASVAVRTAAAVPSGRRARLEMRFYYPAAGTPPTVATGAWTAATSAGWTRLSLTRTAPAGAAYVTVGVVVESALAGESFYADTWGVWRSSVLPAWAPPPARTARPVVAILGDSYESGLGASLEALRWSSRVAASKGWLEANLGRGGTGFVATSDINGCGLVVCASIPDMAAAAVAARPDVVLVSGGRNDLAAYGSDPASVQAGIERTLATLRAGLPSARIVVITPMWDSTTPNPALAAMAEWEQASATAHGATVISGAAGWLVGHPEWIADGVHPDDDGYAEIAARVLAALG